jgi:hypothetical protein
VRELRRAGIHAQACSDTNELRREVMEGCGAVLVAEEILADHATTPLLRTIASQ